MIEDMLVEGLKPMRAMESSGQRLGQQPEEEQSDLADGKSLVYDVASMPGFRFQPTEEELVGFYLRSMVVGSRLEVELINVVDLYRYDPWELPAMAFMQGEREWLFFCPRDRKYPNGARPNRVTASGYWKATGTDRQVRRSRDARCIGLKKTLVFYMGKAPRGRKTEWIMNEYRMPVNEHLLRMSYARKDPREVALCRIYKKPVHYPALCTHEPDSIVEDYHGLESSGQLIYPYAGFSKHREGDHMLESVKTSASTSGTSAFCRRPIFDDLLIRDDSEASCSRSVKPESNAADSPTLSASLRCNLARDHSVDDTLEALLNVQLMHAEHRLGRSMFSEADPTETTTATTSSDHMDVSVCISADQISWLRQDVDSRAHHFAPPAGEVADRLNIDFTGCVANQSSSIASNILDRQLKSSMFSPNVSHSVLTDEGSEISLPVPTSLFSGQVFGGSQYQPAWLQTISPGRLSLLQIDGRSQYSGE